MAESLVLEWLDENRLRAFPFKPASNFAIQGISDLTLDRLIIDAYFVYHSNKPAQVKLESIVAYGNRVAFNVTGLSTFIIPNVLTAVYPCYVRNTEGSLLVVDSGAKLFATGEGTTTTTTLSTSSTSSTTTTITLSSTTTSTTSTTVVPLPLAPILQVTQGVALLYDGVNVSAPVTVSWLGPAVYAGTGKIQFYTSVTPSPVWPTNYTLSPSIGAPTIGAQNLLVKQWNITQDTDVYILARYSGLATSVVSNVISLRTPIITTSTTTSAPPIGITGSTDAVAAASAGLLGRLSLVGSVACYSAYAVNLQGSNSLAATAAGNSTFYAWLRDSRNAALGYAYGQAQWPVPIETLTGAGRLQVLAAGVAGMTGSLISAGRLVLSVAGAATVAGVLRNGIPRVTGSAAGLASTQATGRYGNTTITTSGVSHGVATTLAAITGLNPNPYGCMIESCVDCDSLTYTYWTHNGSYELPAGMYQLEYAGGAMQHKADSSWYVNPGYSYALEYNVGSGADNIQWLPADSGPYTSQVEAEVGYSEVMRQTFDPEGTGTTYQFYHMGGAIRITLTIDPTVYRPGVDAPSWSLAPCPFTQATPCASGTFPVQRLDGSWMCWLSTMTTAAPPDPVPQSTQTTPLPT